ncbi:IGR protein motif-domain-containing protein [Pseudomassariella vexata]|uniref:Small ribosomal subunit protein mS41 n=1 Tax=Pseudomassariella vexata TaxID=1141098 RepID=A0A1Y2EKE1_9PEZI|nr:IGR protein motif-domain-containing protein [Pseudomassariella vexata]ORY72000.1 IGR protein motif-domain-containing protein [Pseudomassariella vexata]
MGHLKPIFRPHLRPWRSALSLLSHQTPQAQPNIRPAAFCISRASSSRAKTPIIPDPTPFCPDVSTFLTLIGRGLKSHVSKFPTWEALFSLTSDQLRELGIEPPRTRRYLIQWRSRFARGQFGIGGDLKYVEDGTADLKILEYAKDPLNPKKYVVNVPLGKSVKETPQEELARVSGYKVRGARTIVGPYALPLKQGEGVRIKITEGMWENKRGRKIDGGERRRTEVRYKKRIQERREMRERGEIP